VAAEILNQIWDNIVTIIEIVAGFAGAITGVVLLYNWIRPKVKNSHTISSYIDYETNEMVEEKEIEISWGHSSLFNAISLPRFSRDAKYEVAYKSPISPKQKLERDHYTVSEAGKFRKIKLVNREFCTENGIEQIYLTCLIPQTEDYRHQIQKVKETNKIIVLNKNLMEIRNYKVSFPNKVTMDKANQYFLVSERFETKQSSPDEATITALILKPLPPAKSGEPGRIEIRI
jgi:hypothetical protein